MIQPGKYEMSNEEYHGDRSHFSSSVVKTALESAFNFKHMVLDGNGSSKSTAAMNFGTLVHTMLLEPDKVTEEFYIHDGAMNKNGTIPAKFKSEVEEKANGRMVVSENDFQRAINVCNNVSEYEHARALLRGSGENEMSIFLMDNDFNLPIKVRPDRMCLERKIIVDVKTSVDPSFEEFRRSALFKYHYDLSAFMYVKAVYLASGVECDFYWLVAGSQEPHGVAVYKVSETTMARGKQKYEAGMQNIERAMSGNQLMFQDEVQEL